MRLTGTILTVVAAGLIAAPVMAQPGAGKGCRRDGDRPHRVWSELGLSEEQQTRLKELHEEMRTEKKEHWDKMKELREQIRTELAKENPGRTTLDNYVARQAELHKAMAGARMDHLLAVKEVLTAEQFDKLLDRHWVGCRGGRKGCRHHGKGHRRGGGGLPN